MVAVRALRSRHPQRYDVPVVIVGAIALLVRGLTLPLFHVTQMVFWKSDYSVLTGIQSLAQQGEYFLALIILVFSVIFPTMKLATLLGLWATPLSDARRTRALQWLGFLGRWSMLDVLILALMIVIVKVRAVANVEPRVGMYVFSAAIFLSMIATTLVERLARASHRA